MRIFFFIYCNALLGFLEFITYQKTKNKKKTQKNKQKKNVKRSNNYNYLMKSMPNIHTRQQIPYMNLYWTHEVHIPMNNTRSRDVTRKWRYG